MESVLKSVLEPSGYRFSQAWLPEKLLTVRSGLGRYGRNNIAYIDGMGSLPVDLLEKLERLYLAEYIPTLSRNLKILFQTA